MKKIFSILISLLLLTAICFPAYAKSGSTVIPKNCRYEKDDNALTYSYDSHSKTLLVNRSSGSRTDFDADNCGAGFFLPTGPTKYQNLKLLTFYGSYEYGRRDTYAVMMLSPAFYTGKIQKISISPAKSVVTLETADADGNTQSRDDITDIPAGEVTFTRDSNGDITDAVLTSEGKTLEEDQICYSSKGVVSSISISQPEDEFSLQILPSYDSKGTIRSCKITITSGEKQVFDCKCKTNSKGQLTEIITDQQDMLVNYTNGKVSQMKDREAENQEDYLLSIWYSSDGSVKTYLPNYFEYKYFSTATIG